MNPATTSARYTPDDLLRMPDGDCYELVDGNLVERKASFRSSFVAGQFLALLGNHCRTHQLGWVVPGGASCQCFRDDPGRVRRADVSFLGRERLTLAQATEEGHVPVAPDLVAEVISPKDLYYEVEAKVNEWLEAGVRLVWVINPRTRQVRVYRADGSDAMVRTDEELSGEDVVPGFRCRVAELFEPPPGVTAPT
jgi:Uma2 family endonuclease